MSTRTKTTDGGAKAEVERSTTAATTLAEAGQEDLEFDANAHCRKVFEDFLEKNGYTNALEAFRKDASASSRDDVSESRTKRVRGAVAANCAREIVLASLYDGDKGAYRSEYARLHAWVLGTLQMYRDELLNVCFPLFVVAYVKTMLEESEAKAAQLLDRFMADFVSVHAHACRELALCVSKDEIERSDFLSTFLREKHSVHISAYSFESLFAYLNRQRMSMITCLICSHVNLRVSNFGGARQHPAVQFESLEEEEEEGDQKKRQRVGEPVRYVCYRLSKADSALDTNMESLARPPPKHARVEEPSGRTLKRSKLSRSQLPSAMCFTVLNARSVGVTDICVAADGSRVAAATEVSTVRLWDVRASAGTSSDVSHQHELVGHRGPVYAVDMGRSNRALISGSGDSDVRLWFCNDTDDSWKTTRIFRGHERPVWDVCFSPINEFFFASASADRTACLWAVDRSYPVRVFGGHTSDVECVTIHPKGNYLAAGCCNGDVRVYDVRAPSEKEPQPQLKAALRSNVSAVGAITFSHNGRFMAVGGDGPDIVVWDLASLAKPVAVLSGHHDDVRTLHFSESSEMLVSGSSDCTVKLWDMSRLHQLRPGKRLVDSSHLVRTFATKRTPVYNVRFTSTNLLMVAGAFAPLQ